MESHFLYRLLTSRVTFMTDQICAPNVKMSKRYVEWFTAIYTGVSFASPELKVRVQKESGDFYTSDEDSGKPHNFYISKQKRNAPCTHILFLCLICAGVGLLLYSALHAFNTLAEDVPPNTLVNPFPPQALLSTLNSISDSSSPIFNTEGHQLTRKDCKSQTLSPQTHTSTTTISASFTCPDTSEKKYSDPENPCNGKYYQCSGGIAKLTDCQENLIFNSKAQLCTPCSLVLACAAECDE